MGAHGPMIMVNVEFLHKDKGLEEELICAYSFLVIIPLDLAKNEDVHLRFIVKL